MLLLGGNAGSWPNSVLVEQWMATAREMRSIHESIPSPEQNEWQMSCKNVYKLKNPTGCVLFTLNRVFYKSRLHSRCSIIKWRNEHADEVMNYCQPEHQPILTPYLRRADEWGAEAGPSIRFLHNLYN